MWRRAAWIGTDGVPIFLGVAIPVAILVAVFGFHVNLVPHVIRHWWSCSSGSEGTPTWSPDGKRIAFAAEGSCDTRIVVVDRDGGDARALTTSFSDWPAWSPDGRSILVDTRHGYALLSAGGGVPERIRRDSSELGASWSSDGRLIAFTHGLFASVGGDYSSTLYVMKRNRTPLERLIGHSCNPGTPACSPDGRSIAVGCYDGLYALDAKTGLRRRILQHDFGAVDIPRTPSWSPDGRMLSFVDGDGVWVLPSDGSGTPHLLVAFHSSGEADTAAWSPDGRWIAFSRSAGESTDGIYLVRPGGGDLHRIAEY
jgi:Tol biopolymer transport system component